MTMKLWAIADLHMPGPQGKSMAIFGEHWKDHVAAVTKAWRDRVAPEDIVLLPGDFSWAMRLPEAAGELAMLADLPGAQKILIRGNHDYWWSTLKKMHSLVSPDIRFLHNNAYCVPPFAIAGTRGWELPGAEENGQAPEEQEERERICRREAQRLELSLKTALAFDQPRLIVMMHYPPFYPAMPESCFADILDAAEPEVVVYGHLHGEGIASGFNGCRGKTRYVLASADALDFAPVCLAEA